MSDKSYSDNLSEILFKPKFDYPETSQISNSGCAMPKLGKLDSVFGFMSGFYRPVLKYNWAVNGGNPLDIEEALSNIRVSTSQRTRPKCFDTVKEYGDGNWIYEFNTIAQKRVLMAHECEAQGDLVKASHHYRLASRYFAIAAYPNLKGDILALNSDALCRSTYKKMFDIDDTLGELEVLQFTVDGKNVKGYLHIPSKDQPQPCIVAVCQYEASITSFFRFYTQCLKDRNIALLVIEMPGIGACDKLNLADHFSSVIEEAVKTVIELPYIDSTNIGLLGSALASTACIRATVLLKDIIKTVVCDMPMIHGFYTDRKILNSLPLCLRSSLCNRLDLDASSWSEIVIPQLKMFSLKEQGLLSSLGVANRASLCLCSYKNSVFTNIDAQIMQNRFSDVEVNYFDRKSMPLKPEYYEKITQFFLRHFGIENNVTN
ncbi:MAG: alpha/beta hydrolase [Succinivibrio sp.]